MRWILRCGKRSFIFVCIAVCVCLNACASLEKAKEPIKVDNLAVRFEAGSAEAQFDKLLSSELEKQKLLIFYYPDDDIVCLEYRVNFYNYSLFWDEDNRTAFINALNRYKEDYEQRNLTAKKYLSAKRQYGTVNGLVMWYSFQKHAQGISYPDLEFGYYFKSNIPYFAVTQREAANVSETTNRQDAIPNMVLYFTREQAGVIAGIFDQEYLLTLRRVL